jgi:hypothetical protein
VAGFEGRVDLENPDLRDACHKQLAGDFFNENDAVAAVRAQMRVPVPLSVRRMPTSAGQPLLGVW